MFKNPSGVFRTIAQLSVVAAAGTVKAAINAAAVNRRVIRCCLRVQTASADRARASPLSRCPCDIRKDSRMALSSVALCRDGSGQGGACSGAGRAIAWGGGVAEMAGRRLEHDSLQSLLETSKLASHSRNLSVT
jgi:hypothetical protein